MGITTDFFVASDEELHRCFPDWHLVTGRRIPKQLPNPFKPGETRLVWTWERGDVVDPGTAAKRPYLVIKQFPHVLRKDVDPVKLAQLYLLVLEGDFNAALEAMCTPALLPPPKEESSLDRLPEAFLRSLVDHPDIDDLAQRWAETEEMELDGWPVEEVKDIVMTLRDLAAIAVRDGKSVFYLTAP